MWAPKVLGATCVLDLDPDTTTEETLTPHDHPWTCTANSGGEMDASGTQCSSFGSTYAFFKGHNNIYSHFVRCIRYGTDAQGDAVHVQVLNIHDYGTLHYTLCASGGVALCCGWATTRHEGVSTGYGTSAEHLYVCLPALRHPDTKASTMLHFMPPHAAISAMCAAHTDAVGSVWTPTASTTTLEQFMPPHAAISAMCAAHTDAVGSVWTPTDATPPSAASLNTTTSSNTIKWREPDLQTGRSACTTSSWVGETASSSGLQLYLTTMGNNGRHQPQTRHLVGYLESPPTQFGRTPLETLASSLLDKTGGVHQRHATPRGRAYGLPSSRAAHCADALVTTDTICSAGHYSSALMQLLPPSGHSRPTASRLTMLCVDTATAIYLIEATVQAASTPRQESTPHGRLWPSTHRCSALCAGATVATDLIVASERVVPASTQPPTPHGHQWTRYANNTGHDVAGVKVVYRALTLVLLRTPRHKFAPMSQPARAGGDDHCNNRHILPAHFAFLLIMEPGLHADCAYCTTGSGGGSEGGSISGSKFCRSIFREWTPELTLSGCGPYTYSASSPQRFFNLCTTESCDQGIRFSRPWWTIQCCFDTRFNQNSIHDYYTLHPTLFEAGGVPVCGGWTTTRRGTGYGTGAGNVEVGPLPIQHLARNKRSALLCRRFVTDVNHVDADTVDGDNNVTRLYAVRHTNYDHGYGSDTLDGASAAVPPCTLCIGDFFSAVTAETICGANCTISLPPSLNCSVPSVCRYIVPPVATYTGSRAPLLSPIDVYIELPAASPSLAHPPSVFHRLLAAFNIDTASTPTLRNLIISQSAGFHPSGALSATHGLLAPDFEAPATLCTNYVYLQHKCNYLHDYDCTRDANFDYHDQCYLCNSVHGTVSCDQLSALSFGQLFLPDMYTLPTNGCDLCTASSSTPTQTWRADFFTTQHHVVDGTVENSVDYIAATVSLHKPDYSTRVRVIETSVLLHDMMHSSYNAGNSYADDSGGTPLAVRPNLSCSTLLGCYRFAAVNDDHITALTSAPSCNAAVSIIDYEFMALCLDRAPTNGTAAVLPHASCIGSFAGIINSDLSDDHVTPITVCADYCVGNTIGCPHAGYIDNKSVASALDALSNCVRPSRTCTSQPETSTDSLGATTCIMATQPLCLSPTDVNTFMTQVTGTEPVHSLLAVHTTLAIVLVEPASTRTLRASSMHQPDHYRCHNAVSGSVHCIVLPAHGSEQPFLHVYPPSNGDGHAAATPTPPPTWHTLGADFTTTYPRVIASVDANRANTSITVTILSSCDSVIGNTCTTPSSPSCSTSVDHTSTDTDDDLCILVSFCPVIDGIAAITPTAPCPGNLVGCPCSDYNYSNNRTVFLPQILSCGVQSIRRYTLQSLGSIIGSRCLLMCPTDVSTGLQAASLSLAHLPSVFHMVHLFLASHRPLEFIETSLVSESTPRLAPASTHGYSDRDRAVHALHGTPMSAFDLTQCIHQPFRGPDYDYILLPAGLCGLDKDQNCPSGYILDHQLVSDYIRGQSRRLLRPADHSGGANHHAPSARLCSIRPPPVSGCGDATVTLGATFYDEHSRTTQLGPQMPTYIDPASIKAPSTVTPSTMALIAADTDSAHSPSVSHESLGYICVDPGSTTALSLDITDTITPQAAETDSAHLPSVSHGSIKYIVADTTSEPSSRMASSPTHGFRDAIQAARVHHDPSLTLSLSTSTGTSSSQAASPAFDSTLPRPTRSFNSNPVTTARTTTTSSPSILGIITVPSADYAFIFGYVSAILGLFIANLLTITRNYPSLHLPHRLRCPPRRLQLSRRTRRPSSSPPCGYGPPHVHIYSTLSNMSILPFDYIYDHYHGRYLHPPRRTPPSTRSFLEAEGALTTADLIIEQVSVTQRSLSVRKLRGTWLTRSESDSETSRSLTLPIRVGQEFRPIDFTADAQDPDRSGSKFSHSSNSRRNTMC
jgi:hypothetical protein